MSQKVARFRFHGELNDFLRGQRRGKRFSYRFNASPSLKDAIEALGVPHTEVDVILVNGESVDFRRRLKRADRIDVYPVAQPIPLSPVIRLSRRPPRRIKFVLDGHLGKLARLLRMLGFDSLYRRDFEDREIARIGVEDRRIILTRDRGILKRGAVRHGYYVRSSDPREQVKEVLARFDLLARIRPFRRCMRCNGVIRIAKKKDVLDLLPPRTRRYYDKFHRCSSCGTIYWEGSHYAGMRSYVEELAGRRPDGRARP